MSFDGNYFLSWNWEIKGDWLVIDHPSIYPTIHLSSYLMFTWSSNVYLSTHLSIHLPAHPLIYILYVYSSNYPSHSFIQLLMYPPNYLPVNSVYLPSSILSFLIPFIFVLPSFLNGKSYNCVTVSFIIPDNSRDKWKWTHCNIFNMINKLQRCREHTWRSEWLVRKEKEDQSVMSKKPRPNFYSQGIGLAFS